MVFFDLFEARFDFGLLRPLLILCVGDIGHLLENLGQLRLNAVDVGPGGE